MDQELTDLGVSTVVIPRKGKPAKPAASTSTAAASAGWSSGAPAARDASPTSSAATASTAPCSTTWPAPKPGAAWACWPQHRQDRHLIQTRRTGAAGHLDSRGVTGPTTGAPTARPHDARPAATGPPGDPQLTLTS